MAAPKTSHPEFDRTTEALEVAETFKDQIRGKTVLVTGANRGGIGYTTAEAFASQSPAHLIIAGRNPSKIQECLDAIKEKYPDVDCRPLKLDLASQRTVRAAAAEFMSWDDVPTLDILVNSAGVMLLPERTLNEDGIEMHFATNHIGHFLFTNLVLPKILAAAKRNAKGATRIINVSSLSPTWTKMRWSDTNFDVVNKDLPEIEQPAYQVLKVWGSVDPENLKYSPIEGYNQSKVANVLFSIGLNKRLYEKHGVLSLALHPGMMWTELARYVDEATQKALAKITSDLNMQTLGAGSSTSLVAATDPGLGLPVDFEDGKGGKKENLGVYLAYCQVSDEAQPLAVSSSEAEKLWAKSEGLVKEKYNL